MIDKYTRTNFIAYSKAELEATLVDVTLSEMYFLHVKRCSSVERERYSKRILRSSKRESHH